MKPRTWKELGTVSPDELRASRLELHWAAQVASAAGATLLEAREDASHTNLGWDESAEALAGHPIDGRRAAVRLRDLSLLVLDAGSSSVASLPLRGETLASALAWLARAFDEPALERPSHEMPAHAVGDGGAFVEANEPALLEIARWFADADLVLGEVAAHDHRASKVRCWPHHFDIATLISIDEVRSVGVGLSPGDDSDADPYFYVTPWPYPTGADLPPLLHGGWHREGWIGAVLSAREVVTSPDQPGAARAFLGAGVSAATKLLRRVGP